MHLHMRREKIAEEECFNVRGISINAEKVEEIFEKGEIERIYINFCNPWPKKRHHKRRLTHTRFLDRYKNILKVWFRNSFKD